MSKTESTRGPGHNLASTEVGKTREQLAACYRMFARRGMDDLIFTHLSARIPGTTDRFLFIPFGMLFEEVTASNLVEVDITGALTSGPGNAVNPAGWIVHRTAYEAVPDAQSVMHLHTICGTAVSSQKAGLLPINQFAVTYSGKIGYHDYDGPGLSAGRTSNWLVRKLAMREQKLYERFKADEASQVITGEYRLLNPEDNNERQQIHEHGSTRRTAASSTP